MISMTRCKIVTITASWTSSRFFSSFSNDASFWGRSRLSPSKARILRNARTTRSTRLRAGSNAHLHGAWTIQHVCCHDCTVLSECVREILDVLTALQGHNL